MLSESSHKRPHFMKWPMQTNLYRKEVVQWFPRAGRRGEKWGVTAKGFKVSLRHDENGLNLYNGDGCTLCKHAKNR